MRPQSSGKGPKQAKCPSHWPANIRYLTTQHYAPTISTSVMTHIKGTSRSHDGRMNRQSGRPIVAIRAIEDPSHPAIGQFGLFATKRIPPHSHIVDYIGEVHSDDRPESDYDLSLYRTADGSVNVGVDASKMGNEARFVNDYRRIHPKPNAAFRDGRNDAGELCMSVWSQADPIRKGEEILVSYGKAWWQARRISNELIKEA
ncbi:hypothetical protein BD410DRAFT_711674 [Rickenella mellea]|uniref:SET domain-containing protein n=1 Tax=Rickenella mellea TaxID=50990 RepID=A0A4Y7QMC1_9AGAM|nr:hypothetical protein BD410DRAFT_711674 [Rickenella mellea]